MFQGFFGFFCLLYSVFNFFCLLEKFFSSTKRTKKKLRKLSAASKHTSGAHRKLSVSLFVWFSVLLVLKRDWAADKGSNFGATVVQNEKQKVYWLCFKFSVKTQKKTQKRTIWGGARNWEKSFGLYIKNIWCEEKFWA